jgi:hypothetical protein
VDFLASRSIATLCLTGVAEATELELQITKIGGKNNAFLLTEKKKTFNSLIFKHFY